MTQRTRMLSMLPIAALTLILLPERMDHETLVTVDLPSIASFAQNTTDIPVPELPTSVSEPQEQKPVSAPARAPRAAPKTVAVAAPPEPAPVIGGNYRTRNREVARAIEQQKRR